MEADFYEENALWALSIVYHALGYVYRWAVIGWLQQLLSHLGQNSLGWDSIH